MGALAREVCTYAIPSRPHLEIDRGQHNAIVFAESHAAFPTATNDDEKVLFEVKVTRRLLCQMILALTLICRGSYRGVIEFLRDLLGVHISEGTVHNVHEAEARQAGVINSGIALSGVRVGLHDEIFQGPAPCSQGSMRSRRSAICWPPRRTATATPGACI
ncbi:MAG: hypothetical protein JF606_05635 [Burkholderiales bacterium]|nr:hypothetical protein [Burkholderiales bacterium]